MTKSTDTARARFMSLVRGGDPGALKRVVKAWRGTTRAAAAELDVTEATLRNWRRDIPELAKMLEEKR